MWWPVSISGEQYRIFMDGDDGAPPGGAKDDEGADDDKGGKDLPAFLQDKDKGKDDDLSDDEGRGLASKKKTAAKTKDDEPTDERPSHIPEKFWDTDKKAVRVDTLAESYAEAEAALSRSRAEKNVPESPDGYLDTFTFDSDGRIKYSDGVDRLPAMPKDDPLFQSALASFHKHGLSTEQAAGVIKDFFLDANNAYPEPFDNEAFTAEQQRVLGKNHEVQVETAQAWIVSLHTQGVLNENEARSLHNHVGEDAHGIMALNKLRAMATGEAVIPVHDPIPEDGVPTQKEWYAMKLSSQYQTDEKFKKKVDGLATTVFPGTGNADFAGLGQDAIEANALRVRQAAQKKS